MKRVLKFTLRLLLAIGLIVGGAFMATNILAERRAARLYSIDADAIAYDSSPAALTRGKYLFESRGCAECHGADGKGVAFINDPSGFLVKAPNISPGTGSVVAKYTEVDWVKAIRHGLKPDGTPIRVMPSEDFSRLTDGDIAALVAYTRSLPPVAGDGTIIQEPYLMKLLYAIGGISDAVDKINHELPPSPPVPEDAMVEVGAYAANMCMGCHGNALSGRLAADGPTDWPPPSNLTPGPGTAMLPYDTVEKFKAMMRTGKRPDGKPVGKGMPFSTLKYLSDRELAALYAFIKTLPPFETGKTLEPPPVEKTASAPAT